jgi:hypothetical protein
MTDSSLPRDIRLFGLAGLIPSVAMVAVMIIWPDWRAGAAAVGVAYGALIASFIGGAWWGLMVRAEQQVVPRLLLQSALPSLLAWPALLVPTASGLLLLAVLFVSLLPTDRRIVAAGVAPGWWMAQRRPLSWGMAVLHLAAAAIMVANTPRSTPLP